MRRAALSIVVAVAIAWGAALQAVASAARGEE